MNLANLLSAAQKGLWLIKRKKWTAAFFVWNFTVKKKKYRRLL